MRIFLPFFFFLLSFLFSVENSYALFSVGGYVPFGPSTQKEATGGRNTLSLRPMVGLNTVLKTGLYHQLFLPEFALSWSGSGSDDYKKTTFFFLADFGHILTPQFIFRYGLGAVMTHISGEGGTTTLNNGTGQSTYYLPDQSSSSWNTTIDLGLQVILAQGFGIRFETFLFSLFNNESRKISYALNLLYYY